MRHLAIAGLLSLSLIVACSDDAGLEDRDHVTEMLVDQNGQAVYVVEGEGVRCVVVDGYQGNAIDCDWEER